MCSLLDLSQLPFSIPEFIFGSRILPHFKSHLPMVLPSEWTFFFSPFCVIWFPSEAARKTLNFEDKPETVVEIVDSSFPFFRQQSLARSDTAAAAQEPPQGSVVPPQQLSPSVSRHHPGLGTSPSLPKSGHSTSSSKGCLSWWCCRKRQEWFQQSNGQWDAVSTMPRFSVALLEPSVHWAQFKDAQDKVMRS